MATDESALGVLSDAAVWREKKSIKARPEHALKWDTVSYQHFNT
jgi:hypothetical protein